MTEEPREIKHLLTQMRYMDFGDDRVVEGAQGRMKQRKKSIY